MTEQELIALRLYRQHLTNPAPGEEICRDLNGIQAQFLSNSRHALAIRGCGGSEWNRGLVKSWTLRGTIHVFREEDLPLYLHEGRRHALRPCDTLEADGWITRERKDYFAALILDTLTGGPATREALRQTCRSKGLTDREEESVFQPWGGTIRALAEAGKIVHLVQEEKAFRLAPPFTPMGEEEAWREILRRYFTYCGPASLRDAAYFLGAAQRELKRRMQGLDLKEVTCGGRTYYDLGDSRTAAIPECLFLAGFDPLLLSYEKRENPCLPPQCLRGIFSLAGIVNPAVLLRGQVVARWKRTGRSLRVSPLAELSPADLETIQAAAAEYWPEARCQIQPV